MLHVVQRVFWNKFHSATLGGPNLAEVAPHLHRIGPMLLEFGEHTVLPDQPWRASVELHPAPIEIEPIWPLPAIFTLHRWGRCKGNRCSTHDLRCRRRGRRLLRLPHPSPAARRLTRAARGRGEARQSPARSALAVLGDALAWEGIGRQRIWGHLTRRHNFPDSGGTRRGKLYTKKQICAETWGKMCRENKRFHCGSKLFRNMMKKLPKTAVSRGRGGLRVPWRSSPRRAMRAGPIFDEFPLCRLQHVRIYAERVTSEIEWGNRAPG